jgi:5-methyltetrahydropteroyltriglutamate--homocysteine methyltransferase
MQRSESRILTTHAGSLPRPPELTALHVRASHGEPVDPDALARAVDAATTQIVEAQLAAGIDVGNNGEQSRESFFTYIQHRMSGFGGVSQRRMGKDTTHFPSFLAERQRRTPEMRVNLMRAPMATGEVRYVNRAPLEDECAGFRRVLKARPGFVEPFMTAPSPGIVVSAMQSEHYPNHAAYMADVAEALRVEYEHIHAQGFILQIDAPDLAMERHMLFQDHPIGEFLEFVDMTVAHINRALADVPRDRVRLHVCWGNYEGPHIFDVPLAEILPRLYRANVGAIMLPFANPRHAHEHRVLRTYPLPDNMLLIAGVIDTTTNYVEHPEVVADRIEAAAQSAGDPHRVLAGTDCGFDTAAGFHAVADEVVWAKLRSLREGADIATKRLVG